MPLIPAKTPQVVKKVFSQYTWDINTSNKELYLTFDDGPTPEITHWTLDILAKYNAKATFFSIGANVEKHPDIFQDILSKGHAIGNHTQHHIKGWNTTVKNYIEDVTTCETVLTSQITHPEITSIKLFRPPYGKITSKQGKALLGLGYNIIMWDVLSFDWDHSVSKENCTNKVISKAKKGSIIVFHDSVKASKNMQYALPKVLDYFTNKGYIFKALRFN